MDIGGSNPVKGDMLVIGGSMLYAITNVSEVWYVSVFFVLKIERVTVFHSLTWACLNYNEQRGFSPSFLIIPDSGIKVNMLMMTKGAHEEIWFC